MPTWGEILTELQEYRLQGKDIPYDEVRRKYLLQLYEKTGRNVILYATSWSLPALQVDPNMLSIGEEDIQGLMEVVHGLSGPNLDLIIHSPGGSAQVAEALVSYLRTKFENIRVIIPHAAMSAATMLACSANKIVMGKHSFIGPIDPQFILQTQLGIQSVPAQTIIDQFKQAQEDCTDQTKLASWMPILGQYGPGLLVECKNLIELAEILVSKWLAKYMFAGKPDAANIACKIAEYLSNHQEFKTHSRHIDREEAKRIGLLIEDLESDQGIQDLVLSVYHATIHTFSGTGAVKIIENHLGNAFVNVSSSSLPTVPSPTQPSDNVPK